MFSSRTNWNLLPNRLTELLEQKRSHNEEIIDLTESNPTRCGFQYDSKALLDSLFFTNSPQYNPEPKGLLSARESICRHYATKNVHLDPGQIVLTASTSEAYSFLFKLLCNAGDSVLIPRPGYPLFEYLCTLNDVHAIPYRLQYDGEWHVDLDSLRGHISGNSRAVVLVHPNNPTGSYIKINEEKEVVDIARRRELSIIADEVFSEYDLGLAGERVGTFAAQRPVLTFTLDGISKLLGLPQMKLAWIVVSGPDDLQRQALARLELIADTYLSVHSAVQRSLPELFRLQASIAQQIQRRLVANLEILRSAIGPASGISLLRCEGGWNAVLRMPAIRTDEQWCEHFLESFNILLHPGHFYSMEAENCVVFSLLVDSGIFSRAISHLIRSVANEATSMTSQF